MRQGRLVIVGSGLLTPAHLSQESINRIKVADVVHALIPDLLGVPTIEKLNPNIKNLADLYFDSDSPASGNNRLEAYQLMVESILTDVRLGLNVCAIFYGHPGVFVYPSHVAITQARKEGFSASMLPAISAEDCLFADLGIDPGDLGCQAYEASQLMFYKHSINTSAALILWQIGVVGDETLTKLEPSECGLKMLLECLLRWYPRDHSMILYEASTLPIIQPRIETITVEQLTSAKVKPITTLFIPQLKEPELDLEFCAKWNVDITQLEHSTD
jgi:uroporphyrin-III C-methyltransferase